MKNAAQILVIRPNYCFATWDRVFLHIWRLEVTREALDELRKLGDAFVAESREPISTLSIVEATSPPPSDKLRAALAAFYGDLAPRTKEHVVLAEGGGFRAALVRSVGVALSAIAPKSLPFRFVSDIDAAAAVVSPHLSSSAGGAPALKEAINELRASAPWPVHS